MTDRTTPVKVTTEGQQLWERFESFLSQVCSPGHEFLLVPSLGAGGDEIRVTRELGRGKMALDTAISACLFSLANQIDEHLPKEGHLCFAAPSEWEWCPQQQFVEEPIRFFFEKSSGGNWYLNMATEVALLPIPEIKPRIILVEPKPIEVTLDRMRPGLEEDARKASKE